MKRMILVLFSILFLLSACAAPSAGTTPENSAEPSAAVSQAGSNAVTFTDALGREVTVDSPRRVAALIGSFADVWCLAGGKDLLVAAAGDSWTSFDLGLDGSVADLGAVTAPNLELLLNARPDFILASSNTAADVFRGLFGMGENAAIIRYVRLPRTCGALLAGMSLAVSGAVIQSVLANPLAAPNIIGVNAGAGLMTALCCAVAPTALAVTPIAAFLGALAGVLLVLFIAERTGAARITLVLAGAAVSSMFGAGVDAVLTFFPDSLNSYSDFRIGGLSNLSMDRITPAFWSPISCAVWWGRRASPFCWGALWGARLC